MKDFIFKQKSLSRKFSAKRINAYIYWLTKLNFFILLYFLPKKEAITNWASLNLDRFEPSLIKNDRALFWFDSFRKKDESKFSIKKFNFGNLTEVKWEIIYPIISPQLGCLQSKFYGVVEDYGQNIIFLGVIYYEDLNNNNKYMRTKYNTFRNIMEKSNILFEATNLNEKAFLPLDANLFFFT